MKIGFIGCGNMSRAMIGGIIRSKAASPEDIFVSSKTADSVEKAINDFGVVGCFDNRKVVENADIIIFGVKPQIYEDVMKETADLFDGKKIAVSIAPGKSISWMEELLGSDTKIVRCNPNTPAMVGEGITAYCANSRVDEADLEHIRLILESFGKSCEMSESQMAAFISVCGSSPAYIFMLIDAMADGGVLGGIPKAKAIELAAQAVLGSAKMVLETGMHPAQLRDMVCSPAGTTIEAVKVLEEKGFRSALIEAEAACTDKCRRM